MSDATDPAPAVLSERRGHVLEITLNRPEKKNPFNPEMLVRLADLWDELDADPDLRVAIVTGAGGNFSAGADLDRLVGALLSGAAPENEFEARLQADLSLIYKGFLKEHQPAKPIIAAVEGYCYAGGTEILQAFDIRVAGENAQIAISEVQRGLFPMSGSTVRLPRQIPFTIACELLLVGDPISGRAPRRSASSAAPSRTGPRWTWPGSWPIGSRPTDRSPSRGSRSRSGRRRRVPRPTPSPPRWRSACG